MTPSIGDVDHNLRIQTRLNLENPCFYDVRNDPFDLYGFYHPKTESVFKRMPDAAAKATSETVGTLYLHTAGGRVRFSTDSVYVAIHCKLPYIQRMAQMPLSASAGFDLYIHEEGRDYFKGTFIPPIEMTDGFESVIRFPDRQLRSLTLHFPLYNGVDCLLVGLEADAVVANGAKYQYDKPVLYYGSSITQGGCASHPGNNYVNRISAKLGCDHLNLGMAGGAKGEDAIAEYMSTLDFSVFVLDYDHNAPSVEHLKRTHERLFLKIRETHPDTPVVIMTKPDIENGLENVLRRDVIYETYTNAVNRGDRNVYFIGGERLFGNEDRDACTVEGCHPNDAGFLRMSETVGAVLAGILNK